MEFCSSIARSPTDRMNKFLKNGLYYYRWPNHSKIHSLLSRTEQFGCGFGILIIFSIFLIVSTASPADVLEIIHYCCLIFPQQYHLLAVRKNEIILQTKQT